MHDKDATSIPPESEQQLRALREQLYQSQKLADIGELAASITHEFNNILTTIINYARMGMRHKDAATRDKAFEKILSAAQRASKLSTGMLAYARKQADRLELRDLATLTEDLLLLVEKDLQRHRIRLETRIESHPQAMVQPGRVQQVLMNLIVNARQAMQPGGILTVAVRTDHLGGWGEIVVQDTGCGIPAEKLRHIFDPFFTTKQPDEQGQGGTGLGLSLAKDVMEHHGGRIRVESTLGKGTIFILKFPLYQGETRAVKPELQKVG
ncbi:MAG: two-component sensor histidine kinase [Planctomycetaceae bacterium]|nr:MAG: two-component sensor histidine kinase [Planctomycetaceae bacterium]